MTTTSPLFARFIAFFSLVVFLISAPGCGGGGGETSEGSRAQIRILHVLPTERPVDITLTIERGFTSEVLFQLTNVRYLESTGYFPVEETLSDLVITVSDSEEQTLLLQERIRPLRGNNTFSVGGSVAAPLLFSSTDNFIVPAEGLARIRFINATEEITPLDFYLTPAGTEDLGPTPTRSALSFTESSSYVEVLTGRYRIRATPQGIRDVVLDSGEISLTSRSVSTLFAVEERGEAPSPLGVLIVADQQ